MIFEGLSLKIEAKKSTALVGCSGSGKSTVINLIERFYDPLRGTVNLRIMRKHVALVSREPNLFEGTIKENIAYGASESVDESEVIGVQLSGGQKQGLAIARAILKNPVILPLDEATSALDSRSEKVVQEALDQVMLGRTSVVVAHRLTTIRNCDEIIVLDKGNVVEKGTHLSLMEKGLTGSYCSLVTLQQKPTNKKFLE
ncbi:hypothetical protein Scep_017673 [Stephania cephalantha]|uniref:ABC transporter domain-containing protein n=1 Tax=Stephania cephalantha TaxID=152367 RepID=A0AAP0IQW3_9MAGN